MFCRDCGTQVGSTDRFCAGCGAKVAVDKPDLAPALTVAEEPTPHEYTASHEEAVPFVAMNVPYTDLVSSGLEHPATFFLLYVACAFPTYVLPYFGSNSAVANSLAMGVGAGALPVFWLHLTFLYLLVGIAWLRGTVVGRSWLPVFPALATIFDMVAGFNWIPLLPTMCHVATLIIGVQGTVSVVDAVGAAKKRNIVLVGLAVMLLLTLFKCVGYERRSEAAIASLVPSAIAIPSTLGVSPSSAPVLRSTPIAASATTLDTAQRALAERPCSHLVTQDQFNTLAQSLSTKPDSNILSVNLSNELYWNGNKIDLPTVNVYFNQIVNHGSKDYVILVDGSGQSATDEKIREFAGLSGLCA